MKRFSLFGILFLGLSLLFLSSRYRASIGEFRIDPSSEFRLEGVTNINRFSCECLESFPVDTYEIISSPLPYILKLNNTDLHLPTEKLDCGRKGINNDLRKALKADAYPYIRIEVESIRLPDTPNGLPDDRWSVLPVKTHITIAGTRKPLHLSVRAKALGDHSYQLQSETKVAMSEFGIDPPRPLLGMIKVDDVITIHLDLKVKLSV